MHRRSSIHFSSHTCTTFIRRIMSAEIEKDLQKLFEQDPRIPCQYGELCYQKNPKHHSKYKHPPKRKNKEDSESKEPEKKRKISACEDECETSPSSKCRKERSPDSVHSAKDSNEDSEKSDETDGSSTTGKEKDEKKKSEFSTVPIHIENLISDLFLVHMPKDFYKFYELCLEISPKEPCSAFKAANLRLIGPYDVLSNKITSVEEGEDKEKYLRHWRYFYDPPEFQTVLKGDDKQGLHFGYWRDDPSESPVFVAKNSANVDSKIMPVADNIFGATSDYLEERTKQCGLFEKAAVTRLHSKLKTFAKNNNFTLDKNTAKMKEREKKVVTRTFHRAGIVVPYNKKTQLGYRELSVTDNGLKKILQRVENAETAEERKTPWSELQEVLRLATIAADESDFGTGLELAHDLFSSGVNRVQNMSLSMFSIAYTHLIRQQFLKIAEAHMKNRKKNCELSVV